MKLKETLNLIGIIVLIRNEFSMKINKSSVNFQKEILSFFKLKNKQNKTLYMKEIWEF
jgi:hypothetical protein